MVEQRLIWTGRPSQWINARNFLGAGSLFVVVLILQAAGFFDAIFVQFLPELSGFKRIIKTFAFMFPILWGVWSWVKVHMHTYEITDQVFREHTGVLNRVTHELELYRVIDTLTFKPFELNIMKLGNVIINTSDASDPVAYILAVPQPDEIRQLIRYHVEQQRERKGIVEVANR